MTDIFNIELPTYVSTYCNYNDNNINNIHILENLDVSSFIHIERIIDLDCPFSHKTCSKFCHIYDSCDFDSRIKYYLEGYEYNQLGEVLLRDNSLNELSVLTHFIRSYTHGIVILDKKYNFYGFSHYHNVFNINLLKSDDKNIIIDNYELKDTLIDYENKNYLFTTFEHCEYKNLIYNHTNMLIYQF
jgi:hypothetical protein